MGIVGTFVRGEYQIHCDDTEYKFYALVASINMVLYFGGIPLFFYIMIRYRNEPWAFHASRPLHLNFAPDWAYYEVFELLRKALLISVVGFVFPDTATQCLYLIAVDTIALLVLTISRPYLADPDDLLSGVLLFIECILFFVAFLIVSGVYVDEDYSKGSMMTFALTLIIIAFCVFVPLNIAQKLPWTEDYLRKLGDAFDQVVSRAGIHPEAFKGMDARARYAKDADILRATVAEFRASVANFDAPVDLPSQSNIDGTRRRPRSSRITNLPNSQNIGSKSGVVEQLNPLYPQSDDYIGRDESNGGL
jgi:hypothetical protein